MATSKSIPIGQNFDINVVVSQISQIYQTRGYEVSVYPVGAGVTVEFSKNNSVFYNIIGMMEGIKMSLVLVDGILTINFTEEKWADKIIAFVIGFACCWITWITGGIGIYNQIQLSNNIANDVALFAAK